MKKRFLSLFLAISFAASLMCNLMSAESTVYAEKVVKDVSEYGSWVGALHTGCKVHQALKAM